MPQIFARATWLMGIEVREVGGGGAPFCVEREK